MSAQWPPSTTSSSSKRQCTGSTHCLLCALFNTSYNVTLEVTLMAKQLPKATAADPTTAPPTIKGAIVQLDEKQRKAWETTRTKLLWTCPAFSHVFITMMAVGKDLAVFTRDIPIAAT